MIEKMILKKLIDTCGGTCVFDLENCPCTVILSDEEIEEMGMEREDFGIIETKDDCLYYEKVSYEMRKEYGEKINSIEVAKRTNRTHKHVLEGIDIYLKNKQINKDAYKSTYINTRNRVYECYDLPFNLAIEFIDRCNHGGRYPRHEFSFGKDIINNLFSDYGIIEQFSVLKYKIDWYVPELKLAIEFDEKHHSSKVPNDSKRQKDIENELGCRFIRYRE